MRLIPLSVEDVDKLFKDPKVVGRRIQICLGENPLKRRLEIRAVVDGDILVCRRYSRENKFWRYSCEDRSGLKLYANYMGRCILFEVKK
ncbi:MAG: hypothetical protein WC824_12460 [Bacteroidota bacterium]|jgi:hypothetical protein